MAEINKTKKLLNALLVVLFVSLAANVYCVYLYTVNPKTRSGLDIAVIGTVGRDPMLDCQLCQELAQTTYKFLPEKFGLHEIDSIAKFVFSNVPSTWRYMSDDIKDNHFDEYKSLIERKFTSREIAEKLGYCQRNY